jgi:hypothetical protein
MYAIRRWSSAHARLLERLYKAMRPLILAGLRVVTRVFGRRLDAPITAAERVVKGVLFDCQMCGDCVLSKTGMTCPMNCPKTIRNGPCGGVRANGMCEVKPDMRCVWVDAWNGAADMEDGDTIKDLEFAVDHNRIGQSSWLRLARDE